MKETVLKYLDQWEASVQGREGCTATENNSMLSIAWMVYEWHVWQCTVAFIIDIIIFAGNSFIELTDHRGRCITVCRLCQDHPLEQFFGCQRQIGRTHENPTVKEFWQNTQALRVVNSFCRTSVLSNYRGRDDTEHVKENYRLPRRQSKVRRTCRRDLGDKPTFWR